MSKSVSLLIALAISVSGCAFSSCTKVYVPSAPSNTDNQNQGTTKILHDTVEFRVIGNATGAKVRYSNTLDGLLQINTTLPFQISIDSIKDSIFLSLEATPTGFSGATFSPFMTVQIFVNGNLFREASSSSIFLDTISVSGTYRR
jgi:hypothetical protein